MKPSNLLCKKAVTAFAIHSNGAKVLTCSKAMSLNDKSERHLTQNLSSDYMGKGFFYIVP